MTPEEHELNHILVQWNRASSVTLDVLDGATMEKAAAKLEVSTNRAQQLFAWTMRQIGHYELYSHHNMSVTECRYIKYELITDIINHGRKLHGISERAVGEE